MRSAPPTMPIVSAFDLAVSPSVRPIAAPAALTIAVRSTPMPMATTQPKNEAPQLMPPNSSRWRRRASRSSSTASPAARGRVVVAVGPAPAPVVVSGSLPGAFPGSTDGGWAAPGSSVAGPRPPGAVAAAVGGLVPVAGAVPGQHGRALALPGVVRGVAALVGRVPALVGGDCTAVVGSGRVIAPESAESSSHCSPPGVDVLSAHAATTPCGLHAFVPLVVPVARMGQTVQTRPVRGALLLAQDPALLLVELRVRQVAAVPQGDELPEPIDRVMLAGRSSLGVHDLDSGDVTEPERAQHLLHTGCLIGRHARTRQRRGGVGTRRTHERSHAGVRLPGPFVLWRGLLAVDVEFLALCRPPHPEPLSDLKRLEREVQIAMRADEPAGPGVGHVGDHLLEGPRRRWGVRTGRHHSRGPRRRLRLYERRLGRDGVLGIPPPTVRVDVKTHSRLPRIDPGCASLRAPSPS